MTASTYANADVLEFYRVMPFNFMASAQSQADAVKQQNAIGQHYAVLEPYLKPGVRALDVGCGTGWLSQSLAWHYKVDMTGIDFNPVAIARAKEATAIAGIDANFVATDLYTFEPVQCFDVVVSLGVLHHTSNCLAGLTLCAERFLAPGGILFIGLYHLYGRKPFLDAFAEMKRAGRSEMQMLHRYAGLVPNNKAEPVFVKSWFRDQVLHPHETQHTLAEVIPLLQAKGLELIATSVNEFGPIDHLEDLYAKEKRMFEIGLEKLARNEFYPGFFVFMMRKML